MFWLAVLVFEGFRCSTDSGMVGTASSLEDCSSGYCSDAEEICYDDSYCDGETEGCAESTVDDRCHADCTESEDCAGSEACTYVGSDTWLCI